MKNARIILYCAAFILMFALSVGAAEKASSADVKKVDAIQATDRKLLLNVYAALAEEHIGGVLRCLKVLSVSEEVKSGRWDSMKGLLAEFANSGINAAAVWFARPDGSYYSVEKGLTGRNLRDRPYFPGLMAGNDVVGDLVISKSTGERTAVVAVPVRKGGKVIGALGVSMSLVKISRMLDEKMGMPQNMIFYALHAKGRVSLHRQSDLLFVFPSDLGSKSLKRAVSEMMSKKEGVVRYEFRGKKVVYFRKSGLTGWVYAIGVVH
jgi:methyl-accepting chemotaxis protein